MAVLLSYHKMVERDAKQIDIQWKSKDLVKSARTVINYFLHPNSWLNNSSCLRDNLFHRGVTESSQDHRSVRRPMHPERANRARDGRAARELFLLKTEQSS